MEQSGAAGSTHSLSCCEIELQENSSQGDKGGQRECPSLQGSVQVLAGSSGLCFKASIQLPAAREKLSPLPALSTDLSV